MDGFDLPMSFGKRAPAKKANQSARVSKSTIGSSSIKTEESGKGITGLKRSHEEVEDEKRSDVGGSKAAKMGDVRDGVRDEEEIGPMPSRLQGTSSMKSPRENNDEEESRLKPTLNSRGIVDDEDDYDFSDSEDETSREEEAFPVSHQIVLKDHHKVVSALAIDGAGARVATGSHDYDVKMWDFGGMDSRTRPFKSFEPCGNYHIHYLGFSPDNKVLLVIPGTSQAKMYTRDGEDGLIFPKGDPYIRDMRHTKGHCADMTSGCWNPTSSQEFITSSNDSTVRIWNTEDRTKQNSVIVVKSKERGARTKVTACAYSQDGKTIAGACTDGTLHLWARNSNFVRPSLSNEEAHVKGSETSGIAFSRDGRSLATRGGDDTVKLWDIRLLRKPLAVAEDLLNLYPETNLEFSPDDKSILTGLSVKKGGPKGEIVALDREGLGIRRRIEVGDGSVVRVAWHSRINQILATTSLGACHVLYSPSKSINGALLPLAKQVRAKPRQEAYIANAPQVIITPHALPMFQEESYYQSKKSQEKARNDPVKSHKPQEPVVGKGSGGRIGASAQQHIVQNMFRNTMMDEDPREALLKYAQKEGEEAMYTSAWNKTQPKPIFSEPLPDQKDKKDEKK